MVYISMVMNTKYMHNQAISTGNISLLLLAVVITLSLNFIT